MKKKISTGNCHNFKSIYIKKNIHYTHFRMRPKQYNKNKKKS